MSPTVDFFVREDGQAAPITVSAAAADVGAVPAWFVNATTGNDANDGRTAATAVKTSERLCDILCPGGAEYVPRNALTTINFSAGTYGLLRLRGRFPPATPLFAAFVDIVCEKSVSAPITLSAVVNTAPSTTAGVRGQFTTIGATDFVDRSRIRVLTGAAAGAVGFSTGPNAGPKNHFVTQFYNYDLATVQNVPVGSVVQLEGAPLVSFSRVDLQFEGPGYVQLQNAKIPAPLNARSSSAPYVLNFLYCQLVGGGTPKPSIVDEVNFNVCDVVGNWAFAAGEPNFYGLYLPSGAILTGDGPQVMTTLWDACTLDGGNVNFQRGSVWSQQRHVEIARGTSGAAFSLSGGGSYSSIVGALTWGAVANPAYGTGFSIGSRSSAGVGTANQIGFNATNPIALSGQNFTFAQIPKAIPRALCGFTINPDPTAPPTP